MLGYLGDIVLALVMLAYIKSGNLPPILTIEEKNLATALFCEVAPKNYLNNFQGGQLRYVIKKV